MSVTAIDGDGDLVDAHVDPRDPACFGSGIRAARAELRAARTRSYRRARQNADELELDEGRGPHGDRHA